MKIKRLHVRGGITSLPGKTSFDGSVFKLSKCKEWGGFLINNIWVPEHMVIEVIIEPTEITPEYVQAPSTPKSNKPTRAS
jgi:hypothetical protein